MATPDLVRRLGLAPQGDCKDVETRRKQIREVNLQLAAAGANGVAADELGDTSLGFLESYREKSRLLLDHRCAADRRIEAFLASHFADLKLPYALRLPSQTLILGRHGVAREMSLPEHGEQAHSSLLNSYRV